jgi:DNA ligase-1
MIDCMLAQKFEDREKDLQYPVYSQPKLDGIRCLCTATTMFSRQGKIFKSAPHILKALESFFKEFPDAVLDGELYCDKLNNDFNKIVSLVRKTKPTEADLDESAGVIQYWVYDVIDTDKKFTERHKWLAANLPVLEDMIVRVETIVAFDKRGLDTEYEIYMSDGYEGQMIRTDEPYERKRSKTLLKRKEFQDAEYEILEIGEGTGNRTGMAGFMVLKNNKGENFNSNIKGSHEFLADLFQNREKYIGEKATCQFFHLSPYGIPRFPYVTSIRNYE